MENNLDNIFTNMMLVDTDFLDKDSIIEIINSIENDLVGKFDSISDANKIDIDNNNGYDFTLNDLKNVFKDISFEVIFNKQIIREEKDTNKRMMYGKELSSIGNVIVISDGNTSLILELLLKNLIAGNKVIFNNTGYMQATNTYIFKIINDILISNNLENMFQLYISDYPDLLLDNYSSINLVICVGNRSLQEYTIERCKNKIITSGFNHYDIYVDDISFCDIVGNISQLDLDINYYVKRDFINDINIDNAIGVDTMEEAIFKINNSGSLYSSAIFTNDKDNLIKFMNKINSKQITVNTSPTYERMLDIKEIELLKEKTYVYPYDMDEE